MPAKRGRKRKTATSSGDGAQQNGHAQSSPPDRATWPGWVEMESEPAFFNAMLEDMGVRGVKVQDVWDLEDDVLATLPHPVHALIFLFKYREPEKGAEQPRNCPKHVWFANQTPDFACATFALLNIVNNIPGLDLGRELRNFKAFTLGMDPLERGDAIDNFDFVKRIHNSFARETDILQADMHLKGKAGKHKQRKAREKAWETRKAKKAVGANGHASLAKGSVKESTPTRASSRTRMRTSRNSCEESGPTDPSDDEVKGPKRSRKAKEGKKRTSRKPSQDDTPGELSDDDFKAPPPSRTTKPDEQESGLRRSKREPKPRISNYHSAATEPEGEEGFHFVAYMPINGHVWMLDGLDRVPLDMGSFSENEGGNWMNVARPALMGRMAQYEASEIQFNLMAMVRDPFVGERGNLLANIKSLQAIGQRLDGVCEDWKSMAGAEINTDAITDCSPGLGIAAQDVEAAEAREDVLEKVARENDPLRLIQFRKEIVSDQGPLRAAVRDSLMSSRDDDERARHRRHDYGTFVRSWLGALVDQEVLCKLLEE